MSRLNTCCKLRARGLRLLGPSTRRVPSRLSASLAAMHTAALVASASGSDGGGGLRWAQLQPQHGLLCARLPPGAPLRASLCAAVADEEGVSAAWVTTCVGSLRGARLRLAGAAQVLPRKPRRQSERGLRITCTYVPYGRRAHASPA